MKYLLDLFTIDYSHQKRIFGLDLIRSIAILLVVYYHGNWIINSVYPDFPSVHIIDGVDLFFVLSGFLIGGILIKEITTKGLTLSVLVSFWKRRWYRTLPNYYLILFVSILYIYLTNKQVFANTDFIKYLFFVQNLFSPYSPFFSVSWSLSIEEWFYLSVPVILFLVHKFFIKDLIKSIAFTIFFIIIAVIALRWWYFDSNIYQTGSEAFWENYFRKNIPFRMDSLVMGVFGAFFKYSYPKVWKNKNLKIILLIIGISIVLSTQYIFNNSVLFQYVFSFAVLSVGILFIFPYFESITCTNKFLLIVITYISLISYSMYLIHNNLILSILMRYFTPHSLFSTIVIYAIYWISVIAGSIMLFKFFEKPMMDLRDKKIMVFSFIKPNRKE